MLYQLNFQFIDPQKFQVHSNYLFFEKSSWKITSIFSVFFKDKTIFSYFRCFKRLHESGNILYLLSVFTFSSFNLSEFQLKSFWLFGNSDYCFKLCLSQHYRWDLSSIIRHIILMTSYYFLA